jgi:hypothetical protein
MAFLSHSIPWHSLSSMFEYGERCDPGPQHPDLWAKSRGAQRSQVEHFARKFQETVREHSMTERRRYRPSEEYVERAGRWNVSGQEDVAVVKSESAEDSRESLVASLEKLNGELRSQSAESWAASCPERRFVYPPDFATTYMSYVPITSGAAYGRSGIVEEFARVETWTDFSARNAQHATNNGTGDEYNRLWLDRKSCSDILRLSIIDSAITRDMARKAHTIETILLLAHHPQVGIDEFVSDGMSCCNQSVGLTSLVKKIVVPFVYLNLLSTFVDGNPSSPLLQSREHLQEYKSGSYRSSAFTNLLPRPAYMNTQSFNNMMTMVLEEHGHVVEHVFFNPLLAPYASGRRSKYLIPNQSVDKSDNEDMRRERDVFTDMSVLKEALKGMWKMLVYCAMLFEEIGQPINWEYVVIESISFLFPDKGCFERLMEAGWMDYEVDRDLRGTFRFFAKFENDDTAM